MTLGFVFSTLVYAGDRALDLKADAQGNLQIDFQGCGDTIHYYLMHNPERLVIDDPKICNQHRVSSRVPATWQGTIQEIRQSVYQPSVKGAKRYRVVIEFKSPFRLSQLERPTHHLRAQVISSSPSQPKSSSGKSVQVVYAKPVVIIIDPGHGGNDPGTIGYQKTREKDVVLSIGRELAKLFNETDGYRAYLTRDHDVFLTLRQRLRVARQHHGDFFISIHADSASASQAHGVSVYGLSSRGASSEAARLLAQKENISVLRGGSHIDSRNDDLNALVMDLQQSASQRVSVVVGESLLRYLRPMAYLHRQHVEKAAFVVLKSPDIPSLLLETGYLSNPNDAKHLRQAAYQRRLARAIYQALTHYFNEHPIKVEHNEASRSSHYTRVVVKSGDTLSQLARRYGVRLSAIKAANHLQSDTLKVGQTLMVPTS